MRPGGASALVLWAAFVGLLAGCSSSAAVSCPPAPNDPPCPDAAPSFSQDVYPGVFRPVCGQCHSPTGEDQAPLLTNYQQIYGNGGATAGAIFTQVFERCAMPPPNAPVPLSDAQRQMLLDWLACQAPDN